ncbi:uncharacterized protein [Antedon mediterranea]|uniref:uncharacterized protein n=1 Tax=Antedon mediterranea TaxID=105859 RepID=UPI003AF7BBAD
MGRRRNKSNKRKPKLTFTDSPESNPIKALCSPVYGADHPVEAARIQVNDIDNPPWVSPQFSSLHFTQKKKCRRRGRKIETRNDETVCHNKKLPIDSNKFGRLQFENEEEVCMSKQFGNNHNIGLELTFKKRCRRKTTKGNLSDISDVELSDQENEVDYVSNTDLDDNYISDYLNIDYDILNGEDYTKLKENHEKKVLAYDTPERDYGMHVHIRRRRDLLPPFARQKLLDAVIK